MSGPRDWDAATYDRVCAPQLEWARPVIERLGLRGDETVLDAGCGSGRVTELLAERLPEGHVIAVDGSPSMVDLARRRLGSSATVLCSDLLELAVPEPVDAVFSNATFHWIADHEALFARTGSWLRPGGRLEAQCGGEGNVAGFLAQVVEVAAQPRFAEHLTGRPETPNFAGPEETEARLAAAGFADIHCGLERRPTRPAEPRDFLAAVCLGPYLEALPESLAVPFIDAVLAATGPEPTLDYVRLNISAVLPR